MTSSSFAFNRYVSMTYDSLSFSISIMRRFSISFTSGFTPHMTHTNPRNISLRRKRSDMKPLSIMTSG